MPSNQIECDPTYSKGAFYNGTGISAPALRFDISPQADGVRCADARHLPIADESLSCMILDPPFLATKGKSLSEGAGNVINRRFGVFACEKELHQCYAEMISEAYRVLKNHGILIFKCQDKISSGKQYLTHVYVIETAVKIGFYPADLFILLARNRIVADWQISSQKHARKYHCYFCVFEKSQRQIEYI